MVVGTNAALVDYFWSNFPYTAQKPVLLYWITSTPDVVNGKWTKSLTVGSHSHTHTRTHTPMGSYCRARCCQAHWEQFRVQTLTQDTLKCGQAQFKTPTLASLAIHSTNRTVLPLKPSWSRSPSGAMVLPYLPYTWFPVRWDGRSSRSSGPRCR